MGEPLSYLCVIFIVHMYEACIRGLNVVLFAYSLWERNFLTASVPSRITDIIVCSDLLQASAICNQRWNYSRPSVQEQSITVVLKRMPPLRLNQTVNTHTTFVGCRADRPAVCRCETDCPCLGPCWPWALFPPLAISLSFCPSMNPLPPMPGGQSSLRVLVRCARMLQVSVAAFAWLGCSGARPSPH